MRFLHLFDYLVLLFQCFIESHPEVLDCFLAARDLSLNLAFLFFQLDEFRFFFSLGFLESRQSVLSKP